ncbi:hypothetical protein ACEYYA_01800 [Paracoccus sp. p3-h83]|uniref:hypothetical protein n=1 Tax=Paracoccus sp. p3-h83 TaxID=3342805 RepID=UPI0035B92623
MTELVRLYIRNVFIGFLLAVAFTAALLALNVANLWHLVSHTSGGIIAVIMLVVFNTIVFAGVQFSIAVMRMADREPGPPRGPRAPALGLTLRQVPVTAAKDRARGQK